MYVYFIYVSTPLLVVKVGWRKHSKEGTSGMLAHEAVCLMLRYVMLVVVIYRTCYYLRLSQLFNNHYDNYYYKKEFDTLCGCVIKFESTCMLQQELA